MSTFGDNTPKQEILDAAQVVAVECGLSDLQLVKALLAVVSYLCEYIEDTE